MGNSSSSNNNRYTSERFAIPRVTVMLAGGEGIFLQWSVLLLLLLLLLLFFGEVSEQSISPQKHLAVASNTRSVTSAPEQCWVAPNRLVFLSLLFIISRDKSKCTVRVCDVDVGQPGDGLRHE